MAIMVELREKLSLVNHEVWNDSTTSLTRYLPAFVDLK